MVQQSPFHAYYAARMLESAAQEEQFLSVFASSGIQVYPFQVAAAGFALRSPYQKGVILCDEAGMGKSHEAMLVMVQRWMEGQNRILLCIPNADLLAQWVELLEQYYTVPYITLCGTSKEAVSCPGGRNLSTQTTGCCPKNSLDQRGGSAFLSAKGIRIKQGPSH